VRIDTRSLPLNTRLGTTALDLGLARGSVAAHRIGVTEVRQLLLEIRDSDGQPVPLGSTVNDEAESILGTTVGEGNLMLVNEDIGKKIRLGGARACQVSYEVPEHFDADSPCEEATATCA
jgi:outer membrane usher protein